MTEVHNHPTIVPMVDDVVAPMGNLSLEFNPSVRKRTEEQKDTWQPRKRERTRKVLPSLIGAVTDARKHDSLQNSFEVTANGTLRTKGFEIQLSGITKTPVKRPNSKDCRAGGLLSPLAEQYSGTSSSSSSSQRAFQSSDSLSFQQESGIPGGDFKREELIELGQIGAGSCGVVSRALHVPTCSVVALKTINVFDKAKRHQLIKELTALSTLESPSVIGFHGAYFHGGRTTLILEYMNRTSLLDVVRAHGPFNELLIQHVAWQVLTALQPMHNAHQVHRDIKPGNLLVNHAGEVKLADFGILAALSSSTDMATTYVGTTMFMSPERIKSGRYGPSADIWSIGVCIYNFAMGQTPWEGSQGYWGIVQGVTEGPSPELDPSEFSPELCDIVKCCCAKDPTQRWTTNQLLEHSFFDNVHDNWQEALAKGKDIIAQGRRPDELIQEGQVHPESVPMPADFLHEQSIDPVYNEIDRAMRAVIKKFYIKEHVKRTKFRQYRPRDMHPSISEHSNGGASATNNLKPRRRRRSSSSTKKDGLATTAPAKIPSDFGSSSSSSLLSSSFSGNLNGSVSMPMSISMGNKDPLNESLERRNRLNAAFNPRRRSGSRNSRQPSASSSSSSSSSSSLSLVLPSLPGSKYPNGNGNSNGLVLKKSSKKLFDSSITFLGDTAPITSDFYVSDGNSSSSSAITGQGSDIVMDDDMDVDAASGSAPNDGPSSSLSTASSGADLYRTPDRNRNNRNNRRPSRSCLGSGVSSVSKSRYHPSNNQKRTMRPSQSLTALPKPNKLRSTPSLKVDNFSSRNKISIQLPTSSKRSSSSSLSYSSSIVIDPAPEASVSNPNNRLDPNQQPSIRRSQSCRTMLDQQSHITKHRTILPYTRSDLELARLHKIAHGMGVERAQVISVFEKIYRQYQRKIDRENRKGRSKSANEANMSSSSSSSSSSLSSSSQCRRRRGSTSSGRLRYSSAATLVGDSGAPILYDSLHEDAFNSLRDDQKMRI